MCQLLSSVVKLKQLALLKFNFWLRQVGLNYFAKLISSSDVLPGHRFGSVSVVLEIASPDVPGPGLSTATRATAENAL